MLSDDGKNIMNITEPFHRCSWLFANSSIASMQTLATIGLTGLPIAQSVVTKTWNDPQRPTTIHNDPQRPTTTPQRPTTTHNDPQRPTTTHNDLTTTHNDPQRPTTTPQRPHNDPTTSHDDQKTSHNQPQRSTSSQQSNNNLCMRKWKFCISRQF
jgi:hypothetical protein